jgi:hypothetical protein
MKNKPIITTSLLLVALIAGAYALNAENNDASDDVAVHLDKTVRNGQRMIAEGQKTFRFDTFGDQAYWGGTLKLHRAIEGAKLGGGEWARA